MAIISDRGTESALNCAYVIIGQGLPDWAHDWVDAAVGLPTGGNG